MPPFLLEHTEEIRLVLQINLRAGVIGSGIDFDGEEFPRSEGAKMRWFNFKSVWLT